MHYYKRNLGDYAKKAGRLSMLQHGSYTLLIDACYDREQFPTMEEAIEWTWASTTAEIEAVEFVLRKFFTLEDGRYVQKRIQEEIADYRAKASNNARIAAERETNRKANKTNRERIVNESLPIVNESPPNQEPITNNQLFKEAKASLSESAIPDCPHQKILDLYREHLPHLNQHRTWEGQRRNCLKARWAQASQPSAYSQHGYKTTEDGLRWWGDFFRYIAVETKLSAGFESSGRLWLPDLEWIVKAANFNKIIDGKYDK